jgi:hypothetical protein
MTQDEGRFGRVNIPKASWAPKGIRPVVDKQIVCDVIILLLVCYLRAFTTGRGGFEK